MTKMVGETQLQKKTSRKRRRRLRVDQYLNTDENGDRFGQNKPRSKKPDQSDRPVTTKGGAKVRGERTLRQSGWGPVT